MGTIKLTAVDEPLAQLLRGSDRQAVAFWAADCAEHVLSLFERERPSDTRPREAIEAARAWARGEIRVGAARTAALAAHAAARECAGEASQAAARAAGHAAATAHVATHAAAVASYAVNAAGYAALAGERDWQRTHLTEIRARLAEGDEMAGRN